MQKGRQLKSILKYCVRNMSSKPKVLRLGTVDFAHKKWEEVSQIAEVIDCTSKNRAEFLEDLKEKYSDVSVITRTFPSVEQTGRFDQALVDHFPTSVKAVCHNGAGYDQVDVAPLSEKGIQLSNVTTPVEAPTADTHIFLMLGALRNFQQGHHSLVQGKWPSTGKAAGAAIGHDPQGKTLGIFGMGGIGRAVRDRAKVFGFDKIIYHNRSRLAPELEKDSEYVSFDELLATSDVVSINIPLNKNTTHIINKEAFEKMKDGVVVVNTARGAIIDESALIEALKSGKVRSCGLDVYEHEPQVPSELYELPNVVSVPHMGTHTYEAMQTMEEFVADNVVSFLKGGKVNTIVPEQYSTYFDIKPLV